MLSFDSKSSKENIDILKTVSVHVYASSYVKGDKTNPPRDPLRYESVTLNV